MTIQNQMIFYSDVCFVSLVVKYSQSRKTEVTTINFMLIEIMFYLVPNTFQNHTLMSSCEKENIILVYNKSIITDDTWLINLYLILQGNGKKPNTKCFGQLTYHQRHSLNCNSRMLSLTVILLLTIEGEIYNDVQAFRASHSICSYLGRLNQLDSFVSR